MTKQTVQDVDPDGDDAWNDTPTAFEIACYADALKRQADADERRRAAEAEGAKLLFGQCLMHLTKLGMKEGHARSMLGKWRSKAKDDKRLARIVEQAWKAGTPDPVSYVTKAIDQAALRATSVDQIMKGKWCLLGWETPRRTPNGPRYRAEVRGQVWRDPYGKIKVLPVDEGTVPPTLEDEPGVGDGVE